MDRLGGSQRKPGPSLRPLRPNGTLYSQLSENDEQADQTQTPVPRATPLNAENALSPSREELTSTTASSTSVLKSTASAPVSPTFMENSLPRLNDSSIPPSPATKQEVKLEPAETSPRAEDTTRTNDSPSSRTNGLPSPAREGMIDIKVLDLRGNTYQVYCREEWTVHQLKEVVQEPSGVPAELQRLIFRGQQLVDDKTLTECKIEQGQTVHLVRQLTRPVPTAVTSPSGRPLSPASQALHQHHVTVMREPVSIWSLSDDPVMTYEHPIGESAKRVKLWSSMLIVLYSMNLLNSIALMSGAAAQYQPDNGRVSRTMIRKVEPIDYFVLFVNFLGVYVGMLGFRAAHQINVLYIHKYCVAVMWLAFLSILELVVQVLLHMKYGIDPSLHRGLSDKDIITMELYTISVWCFVWVISVHHALQHRRAVFEFVEAMTGGPRPVTLPQPETGASQVAPSSLEEGLAGEEDRGRSLSPGRQGESNDGLRRSPTAPLSPRLYALSPSTRRAFSPTTNEPLSPQNISSFANSPPRAGDVSSPSSLGPAAPQQSSARAEGLQVV